MARHKALRRLSISIDNHIHSPSARGRVMRGIHIVVLAATILFLGPASSQAQDMSPLEPEAMPSAHASEVLVSATRTAR